MFFERTRRAPFARVSGLILAKRSQRQRQPEQVRQTKKNQFSDEAIRTQSGHEEPDVNLTIQVRQRNNRMQQKEAMPLQFRSACPRASFGVSLRVCQCVGERLGNKPFGEPVIRNVCLDRNHNNNPPNHIKFCQMLANVPSSKHTFGSKPTRLSNQRGGLRIRQWWGCCWLFCFCYRRASPPPAALAAWLPPCPPRAPPAVGCRGCSAQRANVLGSCVRKGAAKQTIPGVSRRPRHRKFGTMTLPALLQVFFRHRLVVEL